MALGLLMVFASGAMGGGGSDGGAAHDGLSALLDAADSLGGVEGEGLDALLGEMEAAGGIGPAAESERRRAQFGGRPTLYTGSQSMTTIPEPIINAGGRTVRDVQGNPGDGYFVDVVNITVLNVYDTLAS